MHGRIVLDSVLPMPMTERPQSARKSTENIPSNLAYACAFRLVQRNQS